MPTHCMPKRTSVMRTQRVPSAIIRIVPQRRSRAEHVRARLLVQLLLLCMQMMMIQMMRMQMLRMQMLLRMQMMMSKGGQT